MSLNASTSVHPFSWALLLVLLSWLVLSLYSAFKPLPAGLNLNAPLRPVTEVSLLIDHSFVDSEGQQQHQQQIADAMLALIRQARQLIVVDVFLFNDFAGKDSLRNLSAELTEALLAARAANPGMPIVLITDPFNTLYGGIRAEHLERLEQAGINLVITELGALPASNPLWTGLWQGCCRYLGNQTEGGWLPNPVGSSKVTLRSYLHLLNFRANHRKTLFVDQGEDWTALVTSANPHDASSRHSNQAVVFSGAAALDLLRSEIAVMGFSAPVNIYGWPSTEITERAEGPQGIQVLTEGAIRDSLLQMINSSQAGDKLDLEVFYLSHRPLIEALIKAQERGVAIRVLLDPNRDAFGREKNGIPNRQAAWDLHDAGIEVRWCATQGEQCHRKWLRLDRADGLSELLSGSANFTRRNLDNLNLETNVRLVLASDHSLMQAARSQFQRSWSNPEGQQHSLPYEDFADNSRWRYGLYRFMEFTGISTF